MFKINVIILIILIVLGFSILSYFIVKDLRLNADLENHETVVVGDTHKDNTDSVSLEDSVPTPTQLVGETIKQLPPAPDLNRPINYNTLVLEEDKLKIETEIKLLSETLKDTSDYLQGWLQLGILRKYIGDYEGAALAWEYATKIRPLDYVAFNNLGDIYHFYLKDLQKSELAIKKVIELRPDYTPAYKNLFELYTLSYKEKMELADDALLDGINKNSKAYDLMVTLAMYYKEHGDKVGARKYFEMAINLNPPNKPAIEVELNTL